MSAVGQVCCCCSGRRDLSHEKERKLRKARGVCLVVGVAPRKVDVVRLSFGHTYRTVLRDNLGGKLQVERCGLLPLFTCFSSYERVLGQKLIAINRVV